MDRAIQSKVCSRPTPPVKMTAPAQTPTNSDSTAFRVTMASAMASSGGTTERTPNSDIPGNICLQRLKSPSRSSERVDDGHRQSTSLTGVRGNDRGTMAVESLDAPD